MKPQELVLKAGRSMWLHRVQARRGWSRHIRLRLNAVHVGRWPANYVQRDRVSYDHELECILDGMTAVRIGERELRGHGGEALLRPPGVRHSATALHGPVQRICFHFDWDDTHPPPATTMPFTFLHMEPVRWDEVNPTPDWVPFELPLKRRFLSPAWRERLLAIPGVLDELDEGLSLARLETTVTALLLELLDAAAVGDADSEIDRDGIAIKQLLDERYAEDLSLAAIARSHGISASHLSRRFKRVVGISPSAYLQEQRMQRAMQLLSADGLGVADTAAAVGLADPKYFARVFSRRWGMPPSQARG